MRRIGLFGGTFDPPHVGHLLLAEWVRDACDLDEMRLLVAGAPWMKSEVTPASHRVAMTRLAVSDDPRLAVDDREALRDGPTYTAETLEAVHAEEPDVSWTFVLGSDAATWLPSWHRIEDALAMASFVVVPRPGTPAPTHDLRSRLEFVEAPLVELSSTTIRERVAAGRSIRHLVPEPVRRYIEERGLYRPLSHG